MDDPLVRSFARTAGNQIIRTVLGAIGISGGSRRRKTGWF